MLKTEKQEMYYLNYHNALWHCFGFHIAQIGNMLPKQTMLPDWAIGLDYSQNKLVIRFTDPFFIWLAKQDFILTLIILEIVTHHSAYRVCLSFFFFFKQHKPNI